MRTSRFLMPLYLLALLLSSMGAGYAFAQSKSIGEVEAKALALEALKPNNVNVDLYILPINYSPGFYVFEIVSLNPKTSLVVGHIAINQKTGDAWDTAGHCRKLTSSALNEMQTKLRAELKMSSQAMKWQTKHPNCDAP